MPKPYKIVQLDVMEYMRTLPDESVDLVLTDPPYESLEKWRKVGTTTRLGFAKKVDEKGKKIVDRSKEANWFKVFPNDQLEAFLIECKRVMKKNAHIYLHCDETTRDVLRPLFDKVGLKFWKSLIWNKMAIGMGYHWRSKYEFIMFGEKGKKNLNNLGEGDIFEAKRLKGPGYYPTQKPLEIAKKIIANSSKEGDVVLDPFMGAGTTGVAALKLGRIFWGCDLSDKAVERTRERLVKERERQKAKALETAAVDPEADKDVTSNQENTQDEAAQ